MIENIIYLSLATNFLFELPAYQKLIKSNYYTTGNKIGEPLKEPKEQNPLARKPFNCLLCVTFWAGLVAFLLIPLLTAKAWDVTPALCSPVLAVAFNRWFKNLPVRL